MNLQHCLFFLSTTTILLPVAWSLPANSCSAQKDCIRFTVNKVDSKKCTLLGCEYKICMMIDESSDACQKSGSFSHSCVKPDNVCAIESGFQSAMAVTTGVDDGFVQCQIVPTGGVAEFLLKDGKQCSDSASLSFGTGFVANCAPRTASEASCTGNQPGVECVWKIRAPSSCGLFSSSGGDPHFKLWNRTRYGFHGECDLVLMENSEFNYGAGLDIHIRTTRMLEIYSYIETAAIRIGEDILEITTGGKLWLNGEQGSHDNLPATLADFTVSVPYKEMGKNGPDVIRIDLNNGDFIKVRSYKHLVSIDILGLKKDFGSSVGMLGQYQTGKMLSRDGRTVISDPNEFGLEWQVRSSDPLLFRETRAPIYPAQCRMPNVAAAKGRRLMEFSSAQIKEAEEACLHKSDEDFNFCVYDVLAMGDVGMASAW